ncbi:MAG: hypothetical protein ACYCST_10680 [Acidimicrobiales bacterium]
MPRRVASTLERGHVDEGEVGASSPRLAEQRLGLRDSEPPLGDAFDGLFKPAVDENRTSFPPAEHGSALTEEQVGHLRNRIDWEQTTQFSATSGIRRELDTGRGVDDDGGHSSPAALISARVSAALTDVVTGDPFCRSSSHAAKLSAVTSSSGFTTTIAGSVRISSAPRDT